MKQRYEQVVTRALTQYAGYAMGVLLLLLFTACGGVTPAPTLNTLASAFEMSQDGLVVEAEAFHANTRRGAHAWQAQAGALHAQPDAKATYDADYVTKSPRLDYRINVKQSGTYYVWVRGKAAGSSVGSSDSLHIGLDMVERSLALTESAALRLASAGKRDTMDGSRAKLKLTAGTHTLNVWMREDGFVFDKLILTRSADAGPEALLAALAPTDAADAFAPSADGHIDIQAKSVSYAHLAGSSRLANSG